MNRSFILSIILMLCQQVLAQLVPLRIVSQTPVEGAEEARCLMFDHNGLMWIGTDQGVCAYDGYRFKAYRNDAYSPGILPNNYVLRMTEAPENRLWLGTHDGLACFNLIRRNNLGGNCKWRVAL